MNTTKVLPKLPAWVQQLNATQKIKKQEISQDEQQRLDNAQKYAEELTRELLSKKPELDAEMAALDSAQQAAQWMEQLPVFCRIYVGSLNYDVLEPHLRAVFGVFGHITSVSLSYEPLESRHKGFSFIEFDTPEAATNALSMDGSLLGGRNMRVGRSQHFPKEGNRLLPPAPKNRLYISNIHEVVSEHDIEEIFAAYGTVKAIALPPDSTGRKHKGYGFIEYDTVQAANNAMQNLDGFELGTNALRVTKCILGAPMPKGMSKDNTKAS